MHVSTLIEEESLDSFEMTSYHHLLLIIFKTVSSIFFSQLDSNVHVYPSWLILILSEDQANNETSIQFPPPLPLPQLAFSYFLPKRRNPPF